MITDLEKEKRKLVNQIAGGNVVRFGGEIMPIDENVDYDEIERQNREDRYAIASILCESDDADINLTDDERKVLNYLSEDHEYETKDGLAEMYATNPYKLVAEELGFENPEYVRDIIDGLVDDGYVQSYAATRLHLSGDGILYASITSKGRKAIK